MDANHATVTQAVLARHAGEPGGLLPILHEIQDRLGHIPREVVVQIADALNLSRAEVHGVITYYHHFRYEPPGRHLVQVCRAEACQAMGCEALVAQVEDRLGLACGDTTADGRVTFEAVYCLGLCATGPSGMLDGRLVGRLTGPKLDALLEEAGA